MKKVIIFYIILSTSLFSFGQNEEVKPYERIVFNTDRDLYLAGENLYFDLLIEGYLFRTSLYF